MVVPHRSAGAIVSNAMYIGSIAMRSAGSQPAAGRDAGDGGETGRASPVTSEPDGGASSVDCVRVGIAATGPLLARLRPPLGSGRQRVGGDGLVDDPGGPGARGVVGGTGANSAAEMSSADLGEAGIGEPLVAERGGVVGDRLVAPPGSAPLGALLLESLDEHQRPRPARASSWRRARRRRRRDDGDDRERGAGARRGRSAACG